MVLLYIQCRAYNAHPIAQDRTPYGSLLAGRATRVMMMVVYWSLTPLPAGCSQHCTAGGFIAICAATERPHNGRFVTYLAGRCVVG